MDDPMDEAIPIGGDPAGETCPLGADLMRYWVKRHDIFSRWDEGIQVDREGLFSAKPESTALGIAQTIPGQVVIDGLCGVGGISIALARIGRTVIAVEKDADRLRMARHNASVYGVEQRMTFVEADIFEFLRSHRADSVFFDPNWGGPGYLDKEGIGLDGLRPEGRTLTRAGLRAAGTVVLCLPVNFLFDQLRELDRSAVIEPSWWTMWGRRICATVHLRGS